MTVRERAARAFGMHSDATIAGLDRSPDPDDPVAFWVWITPADAARLLEEHAEENFRTVRPGHVQYLARQMSAGLWRRNGEPFVIDKSGRIANGKHRLCAIVSSGVAIRTLMVTGVEPEAVISIDTGKSRSVYNFLHYLGYKHAADLAAAAAMAIRYDLDAAGSNERLSLDMVVAYVKENPAITDSCAFAVRWAGLRRLGFPRTAISFPHFATARVDEESATVFLSRVDAGEGLAAGDPALALRRWGERAASRRDRPVTLVSAAIVIKAMNAMRQGKSIQVLTWRPAIEPFPRVWGEE